MRFGKCSTWPGAPSAPSRSRRKGKLADLQILGAKSIENITNALRIRWVMKNGRLYDANTLGERAPAVRALPLRPWRGR